MNNLIAMLDKFLDFVINWHFVAGWISATFFVLLLLTIMGYEVPV